MIVYIDKETSKVKSFFSHSDYPDSDWKGDADLVIDDNTEFANNIIAWYPKVYINLDEENNIIGIIKDTTVTEQDIKIAINKKKDEISQTCENIIISGITFNGEHYKLTIEDQTNILAWLALAQTGKPVPYHADGKPCHIYEPDEFIQLANAVILHITSQRTYCNLLMRQIEEMTDIKEIETVVYGTALNENYLNQYNNIINNFIGNNNEETNI